LLFTIPRHLQHTAHSEILSSHKRLEESLSLRGLGLADHLANFEAATVEAQGYKCILGASWPGKYRCVNGPSMTPINGLSVVGARRKEYHRRSVESDRARTRVKRIKCASAQFFLRSVHICSTLLLAYVLYGSAAGWLQHPPVCSRRQVKVTGYAAARVNRRHFTSCAHIMMVRPNQCRQQVVVRSYDSRVQLAECPEQTHYARPLRTVPAQLS
jgi:hypothetical protein